MADVRPFRGIRYNPQVAGDLSLNVCPPFDMITPQLQRDLYERSEYNIVRLELARRGQGGELYASTPETQRLWLKSGALRQDSEPSIYITEETFRHRGEPHTRRGLIAAVRVEEYDRGVVLPHENTRPEWVNDRVRLMGAANANYSSLLLLFRDNLRSTVTGIMRAIAGGKPTAVATPHDMHSFKLWQVTDPGTLEVVSNALAGAQLFIADGHHRYEAALRFRSRIRSEREVDPLESINFRMAMLVSLDEPGLMTLGYHRVIARATFEELGKVRAALEALCDLTPWAPPAVPSPSMGEGQSLPRAKAGGEGESTSGYPEPRSRATGTEGLPVAQVFQDALGQRHGEEVVFGVYGYESGKYHVAHMRNPPPAMNELESSEYSRLHSLIIRAGFDQEGEHEALMFFPQPERAVAAVDEQGGQMAFIMRPVPLREFTTIVSRGWRLPPKATNFNPKPPAGTVIQSLQGVL